MLMQPFAAIWKFQNERWSLIFNLRAASLFSYITTFHASPWLHGHTMLQHARNITMGFCIFLIAAKSLPSMYKTHTCSVQYAPTEMKLKTLAQSKRNNTGTASAECIRNGWAWVSLRVHDWNDAKVKLTKQLKWYKKEVKIDIKSGTN